MAKIDITEDITDPNSYSIQEDKIKSEKDRELDEAEIKKQVTRNYIQDLRTEFLKLINENDAAKVEWQLPRTQFSVDSTLHADIERETSEKIENVKKDLQWISEKETIGLEKLKRKFLDDVVTESIEIKAFRV